MNREEMRSHILQAVLGRLDLDPARRAEALRDFLALSLPGMGENAVEAVAARVPELPRALYEKWINLFIDRLFETITPEQLADLCDGSSANNATLGMVYLLFMESARMEKQVADDLAALGRSEPGRAGDAGRNGFSDASAAEADALALYLKARLAQKTGRTAKKQ